LILLEVNLLRGAAMLITHKQLTTFALLLASCLSTFAQEPPRRRHGPPGPPPFGQPGARGPHPDFGPRKGPSGSGFEFLSSEMRSDGKVVKGAPYAATATVQSSQILGDGTRITRTTSATIHRDSEGRTRREQKLDFIGPFTPKGEPPHLVFITDTVTRTQYVLNVGEKKAHKFTSPPRPPGELKIPAPAPLTSEQSQSENLGSQMMEGVEATGTRSVITIPAGQIGNDRPIEIVSERWDSPELQITLMSRHSDPRIGETVYKVTSLTRGEQPHSLFEVPADYSLNEGFLPEKGGRPPQKMRRPHND
jgi:hypothetical protein